MTYQSLAHNDQLVYDFSGADDFYNATISVELSVSQEIIDSGTVIQPLVQLKAGSWPGKYCWINNADLTLAAKKFECKLDSAELIDTTDAGFQIGVQVNNESAAPAGSVTIHSFTITPESSEPTPTPESALNIDFEDDAVGTEYGTTGWDDSDAISEVVTLASVTGLTANGSSVNVLKVSPPDYNYVPKFSVTIPDGQTLAGYVVKVDAYFPRDTLGLTGAATNFYKDLLLLAGDPMTGAAKDDGETPNPLFHSKVATEGNVDAWTTFTLTPDATKGASLTGAIEIAIGISRPAVSDGDDYYLDNVRLELVE